MKRHPFPRGSFPELNNEAVSGRGGDALQDAHRRLGTTAFKPCDIALMGVQRCASSSWVSFALVRARAIAAATGAGRTGRQKRWRDDERTCRV